MAYADKQKEKEAKEKWNRENPEKLKAIREAYNEKRRQKRRDAVVRGDEAAIKRLMYREMDPAQKAAMLESRKEYQRQWQKDNYEKNRARHKERMLNDPEYAEKVRAYARQRNALRGNRKENETPEQRERRLQRDREYNAKRYREKKAMQALIPVEPKVVTPKVAPPPPLPTPKFNPHANKKRPGRLMALAGWNRF